MRSGAVECSLKYFTMESGLWRAFKYVSSRSTHEDSILYVSSGLRCAWIYASRLLSASMEFWVGPCFPCVTTPLLILSAVAGTKRRENSYASFGSFTRSMRAFLFCAVLFRYGEDFKCSVFLQRHRARKFQSCGLTLAPKNDPIGVHSVWPTDHTWDDAMCGCNFSWRNVTEVSS